MIGQLLEITRTPISLELRTTPAKLETSTQDPSYNMSRSSGRLDISHQYPQINIDTSEGRASMNLKSTYRSMQDFAAQCVQDFQNSMAQIFNEGDAIMRDTSGANLRGEFAKQKADSVPQVGIGFLPSVPANIHWAPPQLDMRYEMDRLSFDWRTSSEPEMQYTPAKIEYLVKQYPKVEFKYMGKPLYVPPSAEPGYVPPELDVTA